MTNPTVSVSSQRFAQGMTFDDYLVFVATPANLAREATEGAKRADQSGRLKALYDSYVLSPHQAEALKSLAAQDGGPAKVLVIAEEWSSDCRRDLPMLQRIAEAMSAELRIFPRDGQKWSGTPEPAAAESPNADLMAQFLNRKAGGPFQSIPVAVFFTRDMAYLYHYTEFPAIYEKDRVVARVRAARPGETLEETQQRGNRDFGELQNSPFFRVWASAAVDEIVSALHRRLLIGTV